MKFTFHGLASTDFEAWVKATKTGGGALNRDGYLELEKPSKKEPVHHYGSVDADLYHAILNRCVDRNTVCIDKMMAEDANMKMDKKQAAASNAALRLAKADPAFCATPVTDKNTATSSAKATTSLTSESNDARAN